MHKLIKSGSDVLDQIMQRKHEQVASAMQKISLAQIRSVAGEQSSTRPFMTKLREDIAQNKPAVIAEIKKASPSKGVIREDFQPQSIANSYAEHGASCLSVLTDTEFFLGSTDDFKTVRASVDLPMLRKDFICHEYQIYEARAMGADCILLIAAVLEDSLMQTLCGLAQELNLDVLVEVHTLSELQRSKTLGLTSVGINNRNLRNFSTELNTTIDLLNEIDKSTLVITESGITSKEDVKFMQQHNVNAFLVGEAFMRAANPGQKMAQLFY